ncbi:MAG TPA: hypothetical protein VHO24_19255 [Opitutaceae bacterium]|nr:hypothetical protein [Opitutaceae bacterium]
MSSIPRPRGRYRWLWIYLLGAMAVSSLLLAIGVYNLVTLTSEARVLKRTLLASDGFRGSLKVQGTVGPILLGGARTVLRFLPDVPAEVREGLAAMKSASVGVYKLDTLPSAEMRNEVFAAADAAMERSGWVRIVSVSERHQRVVVYAPANDDDSDQVRLCVAVCDQKQLVVVSGRADAEKLGEFAQRRIPRVL